MLKRKNESCDTSYPPLRKLKKTHPLRCTRLSLPWLSCMLKPSPNPSSFNATSPVTAFNSDLPILRSFRSHALFDKHLIGEVLQFAQIPLHTHISLPSVLTHHSFESPCFAAAPNGDLWVSCETGSLSNTLSVFSLQTHNKPVQTVKFAGKNIYAHCCCYVGPLPDNYVLIVLAGAELLEYNPFTSTTRVIREKLNRYFYRSRLEVFDLNGLSVVWFENMLIDRLSGQHLGYLPSQESRQPGYVVSRPLQFDCQRCLVTHTIRRPYINYFLWLSGTDTDPQTITIKELQFGGEETKDDETKSHCTDDTHDTGANCVATIAKHALEHIYVIDADLDVLLFRFVKKHGPRKPAPPQTSTDMWYIDTTVEYMSLRRALKENNTPWTSVPLPIRSCGNCSDCTINKGAECSHGERVKSVFYDTCLDCVVFSFQMPPRNSSNYFIYEEFDFNVLFFPVSELPA
jgi:hypothetical protein